MTRAYVASGFVRGGQLKLRQKLAFQQACAQWPDGEVLVTIAPAQATRSRALNARYWASYVAPLAAHVGASPLEMHAYLKQRFVPASHRLLIHDQDGVVVDDVELAALTTTTTLSKDEFSAYLDQVVIRAPARRARRIGSRGGRLSRRTNPVDVVVQFFESAPLEQAQTVLVIARGILARRTPKAKSALRKGADGAVSQLSGGKPEVHGEQR